MPEPELLRLAQQFKDALEAQDEIALQRIIDAYGRIYRTLQDKIDALLIEISTMENPTRAGVSKLIRFKALISQVTDEIEQFQGYLRTEILAASELSYITGEEQSQQLVEALLQQAGIQAQFNNLPANSFESMLSFLQPDSPLYKRILLLAETSAEYVRDTLLEAVALGYNPRKTAQLIRDAFGRGLTDALRMARTAQLWASREAARANYLNNADIIKGWVWFASLDDTVCASCVAMHGTIHDLDEPLNDHHNGRCAMLPYIPEFGNPVEQTGEDWFKAQNAGRQAAILGKGKYKAWTDGLFEFSQLSTEKENDVYGMMRVETPLNDLVKCQQTRF